MSQNIHKLRINEFKVTVISTSIYDSVINLLLSFIGFYSIYFFLPRNKSKSSAPRTAPAGCCSSAVTPNGRWGNYTSRLPCREKLGMKRHGFLLWEFVSQSKFSNVQPVQEKVVVFKHRPEHAACVTKKTETVQNVGWWEK